MIKSCFKTAPLAKTLLLWILVFCPFYQATAVTLPDSARLVPEETIFLVNIENFEQLYQQLQNTNWGRLFNDPAMANFVKDIKSKSRARLEARGDEIAKAIIDANALPTGRVTFALTASSRSAMPKLPHILLISQWGTQTDKIKKTINKITAKSLNEGARRTEEIYHKIEIITLIKNSDQPYIDPVMKLPQLQISYCFIDDVLLASSDIDTLKFVIARIKNTMGRTLADDPDYTETIKALGTHRDFNFYINVKQILKLIIAEDLSGQMNTMLSKLGLDNITALGFTLDVAGKNDTSLSAKMLLKVNGPKTGVLKMLELESDLINPPQFLDSSACSLFFINWDIKKAYDEIYRILLDIAPPIASEMFCKNPF